MSKDMARGLLIVIAAIGIFTFVILCCTRDTPPSRPNGPVAQPLVQPVVVQPIVEPPVYRHSTPWFTPAPAPTTVVLTGSPRIERYTYVFKSTKTKTQARAAETKPTLPTGLRGWGNAAPRSYTRASSYSAPRSYATSSTTRSSSSGRRGW